MPTVVNPENPETPETPGDTTTPDTPKKKKKGKKKSATRATEATEGSRLPFYCPGCGKQYGYQRECVGTGTAPHPAIEVISTGELDGDPADHTPAPPSLGA